ncbi:MAG TPA: prolipoprotein diacylglyceryl transferase family protein [Gemmatimonadales bacterium]|nr:prolipoprotein diacylglyceryl transferase family protein [Gemmatimonadales bacterium]
MRPRFIALLNDHGLAAIKWVVPTHELMYSIMVFVVVTWIIWRSREASMQVERTMAVVLVAAAGFLVGTRVFYLLSDDHLSTIPYQRWFNLTGTASWGGYIGATLAIGLYLWREPANIWRYLDLIASCAGMGIFIGRWSCLLAGDDFGRVAFLPWCIQYPPQSWAYETQIARGALLPGAVLSLPTHPFQLYLGFNGLAEMWILSAVWHRAKLLPGVTLSAFLALDGLTRFALEMFRDPDAGGSRSGLSTSQWMCLLMLVLGFVVIVSRYAIWRSVFKHAYARSAPWTAQHET